MIKIYAVNPGKLTGRRFVHHFRLPVKNITNPLHGNPKYETLLSILAYCQSNQSELII